MAPTHDIHQHLVDRCRQGERSAQAELYRLYSKAMYNVSLRIVDNREEAEDVLQESFISAFQKIQSFRGESSFGAWLKRIVINASLKQVRQRIHFSDVNDQPEEWEEEESEDSNGWDVMQVQTAMMSLPDGFRTVFTLYLLEGWSHKEIAKELGVSEGTSKSQLNRAKKKVKAALLEMNEHGKGQAGRLHTGA